jgi:hypothetical protein
MVSPLQLDNSIRQLNLYQRVLETTDVMWLSTVNWDRRHILIMTAVSPLVKVDL